MELFLSCTSLSEPLHHRGGEAVQPFPPQPLCRAPSGSGHPAVPGRRLDPVQGAGLRGATETERPLQQEVVKQRTALHNGQTGFLVRKFMNGH